MTSARARRNTLLLAAGELVGHTLGKLHDLHQILSIYLSSLYLFFFNLSVFKPKQRCRVPSYWGIWHSSENHADIPLAGVHIIDTGVIEIDITALNGVGILRSYEEVWSYRSRKAQGG